MVVYGRDGKSTELPLVSDREDQFEAGQTNHFLVSIQNLLLFVCFVIVVWGV